MDHRSPRQQDPLALAFFGAAAALLAGLLLYILVFKAPEPKAPEAATPARAFELVGELRRQMAALTERFKDKPAIKPATAPAAKTIAPSPAAVPGSAGIEAELSYIEAGAVQARARETLWYLPKLAQAVKVVREGRTPDESSTRIVAELQEFR